MLAREGVVMHPFWGRSVLRTLYPHNTLIMFFSTEVGPATMYVPRDAPPPHEWEYFKFSNHIEFHMQPQKNMKDVYEPIMIVSSRFDPPLTPLTKLCTANHDLLPACLELRARGEACIRRRRST